MRQESGYRFQFFLFRFSAECILADSWTLWLRVFGCKIFHELLNSGGEAIYRRFTEKWRNLVQSKPLCRWRLVEMLTINFHFHSDSSCKCEDNVLCSIQFIFVWLRIYFLPVCGCVSSSALANPPRTVSTKITENFHIFTFNSFLLFKRVFHQNAKNRGDQQLGMKFHNFH